MEFDKEQLLNEYVQRQSRLIADLTNKNLMLETRLSLALAKIQELMPSAEEEGETTTSGDGY